MNERKKEDYLLPKQKIKSWRKNPKSIIIFGNYKTGKTTALAELENSLIVDLEGGSDFVDAVKIDVLKEAKERGISNFEMLSWVIKSIKNANEEDGKFRYKYIAIDTVSSLEDIALELAKKLYRATPMGKNWNGTDVTELPNGAGYFYSRKALLIITNKFEELCETLIMTGHIKDKLIETNGEEISQRALALTGKTGAILCAHTDAIAYIYRDKNKSILNFEPSENLSVGTRSKHLMNKKIVLSEMDENQKIKVYWDKIFI